jgi:hypothetical protein
MGNSGSRVFNFFAIGLLAADINRSHDLDAVCSGPSQIICKSLITNHSY